MNISKKRNKNILNKQYGFTFLEMKVIIFSFLGIMVFMLASSVVINNIAENNKKILENEGYSVIKKYTISVPDREEPDTSNCKNGKIIFVTRSYEEVNSLDDAGVVMFKLKK